MQRLSISQYLDLSSTRQLLSFAQVLVPRNYFEQLFMESEAYCHTEDTFKDAYEACRTGFLTFESQNMAWTMSLPIAVPVK